METRIAASEDEAVAAAAEIGYPVVLKLYSETITHKTDVGGVQLNLRDDATPCATPSARSRARWRRRSGSEHFQGVTVQPMIKLDGYELIIGSSIDPQFGPVLLFGTGGQLVEVFKDRALALPPLNTTLARRMMEQTKIYKALKGVRGRKPVDLAGAGAAAGALQPAGGRAAVDQGDRHQPAAGLAGAAGRARRARGGARPGRDARTSCRKLAIRPYPTQYVAPWKMKDGTTVHDPPDPARGRAADGEVPRDALGAQVYLRYLQPMKLSQRVAHERLTRICFNDYDREMALVAEHKDPKTGEAQVIAVGRLKKTHGTNEAEFAVLISDEYQGRGLGTELVKRLLEVAGMRNWAASPATFCRTTSPCSTCARSWASS